jgi:hypothetical protein
LPDLAPLLRQTKFHLVGYPSVDPEFEYPPLCRMDKDLVIRGPPIEHENTLPFQKMSQAFTAGAKSPLRQLADWEGHSHKS